MSKSLNIALIVAYSVVVIGWLAARPQPANPPPIHLPSRTPIAEFLKLTGGSQEQRVSALAKISANWHEGDTIMLIESASNSIDPRTLAAISDTLSKATGQTFGVDFNRWYQWLWNQPAVTHPNYANFKANLYKRIDPRFAEYFVDVGVPTIRLDEIRWGGVRRDGIPPLKNPETISVAKATYLADSDIVFGVEFGGHARAYPKRIVAWHEMVKDVVGGHSINCVYCTLCGAMIVYQTELDGKHYELGTSGFLYRSNKLMYDHETKSMWSTLDGKPVLGPLVRKALELKPLYVVTTTWGDWRQTHPSTDVLSLNTGHRRNYDEGEAYHEYFATDELMFTVPKLDTRLKNKEEVLIVRDTNHTPIAIATAFLLENRIYHDSLVSNSTDQPLSFVVLSVPSGANRVYCNEGRKFERWIDGETVLASDGTHWQVTEAALELRGANGQPRERLLRVPAHRAFWFGWSAANPDLRLVE